MAMSDSFFVGTMGFTYLIGGILWIFPLAYLVLRWRAYRESGPNDPQLGIKTALYYFKTLALQVLLVAGFCLLYGLFSSQAREQFVRLAIGLVLGGGLIYGLQSVLIDKYTNTHSFPAAARFFNGFNLVMCGLVAMAAIIGFFALIVQSYAPGEPIKVMIALGLVYGPAAAAQAFFLFRHTKTGPGPSTSEPVADS